jgi:hypothetical protein
VFVEIDSLREQQVTENTLIFLQLLVKGSHDDASELETSPNSRTARKQNEPTRESNVLPTVSLLSELGATFETRERLLHVSGDNLTMQSA